MRRRGHVLGGYLFWHAMNHVTRRVLPAVAGLLFVALGLLPGWAWLLGLGLPVLCGRILRAAKQLRALGELGGDRLRGVRDCPLVSLQSAGPTLANTRSLT